jgi:hypothetical protein
MRIRHLTLAAAAIAASSPSISNASPQRVALIACASAFATSLAAPGSAAPSYRVEYRGGDSQSALTSYYVREYTFYLQAHHPKSGRTIARATCSVNADGTIVALEAEPVTAAPRLAAQ